MEEYTKIKEIEFNGLLRPSLKKKEYGDSYFKIKCPKSECSNMTLEFSGKIEKGIFELMLFCSLCNSFTNMKSLYCIGKVDIEETINKEK